MEWLEVSVRVIPEAAEAVAEVLSRYAPEGVAIDAGMENDASHPVTVKAYLPVDERIEEQRRRVEEALGHLSHIWSVIPEPVFTFMADTDWTAKWKQRIPVLHLGPNVVIKPTWRGYTPNAGEIVLEMDPGMAFGTGLHPTTQLCVAAVEDLVQPGMDVLDLGTGTGILAMIAARLGAGRILAVDTDENAVTAARWNVRVNELDQKIRLLHGSLSDVHRRFDLILANILTHIIIEMAASGLADRLQEGGTVVASGILEDQAESVAAALNQGGLRVTAQDQIGEWVAIRAKKPQGAPPGASRHALR
ncbi:MAG: 50S ribosomal protein L11 methyltransferase [Anaerolineae bacterium]